MRVLILILLSLASKSYAQAGGCFEFKQLDKNTQLKQLKVVLSPAQERGQDTHIAEIKAIDTDGYRLGGRIPCTRLDESKLKCHRDDDGGSFELKIDGDKAQLSTSYVVIGEREDNLTLQSPDDEPWVFAGKACQSK